MRTSVLAQLLTLPAWLRVACFAAEDNIPRVHGHDINQAFLAEACPDYTQYAKLRQ
jgi:hypothetical protein